MLIILLYALFNYIMKVIKYFYNILKVDNNKFATYYIYNKKKLEITEFIYNLYLLYKFDLV